MLRSSLLALLLIALASPSLSFKCYKCMDCAKNTAVESECSLGSYLTPICLKEVTGTQVERGCTTKALCEAAAKISESAAEYTYSVPMTYCCEGDLCNGAPAPVSGLGLLLVPALVYLAA